MENKVREGKEKGIPIFLTLFSASAWGLVLFGDMAGQAVWHRAAEPPLYMRPGVCWQVRRFPNALSIPDGQVLLRRSLVMERSLHTAKWGKEPVRWAGVPARPHTLGVMVVVGAAQGCGLLALRTGPWRWWGSRRKRGLCHAFWGPERRGDFPYYFPPFALLCPTSRTQSSSLSLPAQGNLIYETALMTSTYFSAK